MQQAGISVIVPVHNEPVEILARLHQFAEIDSISEVIVSDSSDLQATVNELRKIQSRYANYHLVRCSKPGRAEQMNQGARHAKCEILWFVHADTEVPGNASELIRNCVAAGYRWGRFDVGFDSDALWMKTVAWTMNIRSSLSKICTGDQAIYVTSELFNSVEGFPKIVIMEDVALSKILKDRSAMYRVKAKVITSARRWESHGYMRTILVMWTMRFLYWVGVPVNNLAKFYRQAHQ